MVRLVTKSRLLLFAILLVADGATQAEDFRIENRVFVEGKKEAESQSSTFFQGGTVYDFMSEPAEVTIFDKPSGRFVLLNMTRQEQTELSLTEVAAFAEKLKQLASKQTDPLSKFFADPKFEERFDAASGDLVLSSPLVTYRITTKAAERPVVSKQYREFSDWYARLNAMLNTGARPPQARLMVNDALARQDVLAREVTLTITALKNNTPQKTVVRSEHDWAYELTRSDLDRIENAQKARANFRSLQYVQYAKNRNSRR